MKLSTAIAVLCTLATDVFAIPTSMDSYVNALAARDGSLCKSFSQTPHTRTDILPDPNNGLNDTTFANLKFFAQYASAAYDPRNSNSSGTPIGCCDGTCNDVQAAGAYTVNEFYTLDLTQTNGFLAVDPTNKLIVLSFRGTTVLANYLQDLLFEQIQPPEYCLGCFVDIGFYNSWLAGEWAIKTGLVATIAQFPSHRIVVTGHSLGAAVATLAVASLRQMGHVVDFYGYGCPRVGNSLFADFVTNQAPAMGNNYRVTHNDDLIPRLPPAVLDYRHISPEFWLAAGPRTRVDYSIGDVQECIGNANFSCNAGTTGLNTTAHSYYFEQLGKCSPGFSLKRALDASLVDDGMVVDSPALADYLVQDLATFGEK